MAIAKIDTVQYIEMGQNGDNIATNWQADMSDWLLNWPHVSVFVIAVRHGENKPYVASTTMDEAILNWTFTATDTAVTGVGYAEIRAVGTDGLVKKSKVLRTIVNKSIDDIDIEVDDPMMGFMQQTLSAAALINENRWRLISDEDGWVEFGGGQVEGGGYLLDTTLTELGRAADAKAVGDALSLKLDAQDIGQLTFDRLLCYPVGSVYITDKNVSPSTLFGGEWVQDKGVMLFAADSKRDAGTVGGMERVTLTPSNIPKEVNGVG